MPTNNINVINNENEPKRLYLAAATIGIVKLFKKTIHLLGFINNNYVIKEENA